MIRKSGAATTLAFLLCGLAPCATSQGFLDLETGVALPGYNDLRIPGDTGTRISFTDELTTDPTPFVRFRGTYRWQDRHNLSVLVAPLRQEAAGSVDRPVAFMTAVFPAGTPLRGRYRFDSYRLTYRRDFARSPSFRVGAGFTAKIRDAAVELSGGGLRAEKTNTGFVPILNFALEWQVANALRVLIEADALAAPQGRAEDVLAAIRYDLGDHFALKGGYRLLEGGADNDEVYSFALVHYLVVGAIARF